LSFFVICLLVTRLVASGVAKVFQSVKSKNLVSVSTSWSQDRLESRNIPTSRRGLGFKRIPNMVNYMTKLWKNKQKTVFD